MILQKYRIRQLQIGFCSEIYSSEVTHSGEGELPQEQITNNYGASADKLFEFRKSTVPRDYRCGDNYVILATCDDTKDNDNNGLSYYWLKFFYLFSKILSS